ncbi:DUF3429 domain-containing protein [Erythrobacter litoralis]|uniref:DUF3429 domain-containing protein n=1 Tax=Erythrobacter litoralis (strain HTCC2594) TaxID=314225 RepID=Q2NB20_ERYLH|nr:DUF3429 domain-containing protein [Erythrobacter litoralis]ABC63121.1 hypothetical protein ELI_05145 [Erythrobacter litoralis HTCC2594]
MQEKPAAQDSVPPMAMWLGYAGLLPQLVAVGLVMYGGDWKWIALAASYAYAALIFSFLGGVWWGQVLQSSQASRWWYAVAIMPSLIGLALFLPWTFGADWPGPSLLWLGIAIVLSPLVDRRLGLGGVEWMKLRWRLSVGLGGLSLVLALLALEGG